jgi:hypothetical protein
MATNDNKAGAAGQAAAWAKEVATLQARAALLGMVLEAGAEPGTWRLSTRDTFPSLQAVAAAVFWLELMRAEMGAMQ